MRRAGPPLDIVYLSRWLRSRDPRYWPEGMAVMRLLLENVQPGRISSQTSAWANGLFGKALRASSGGDAGTTGKRSADGDVEMADNE